MLNKRDANNEHEDDERVKEIIIKRLDYVKVYRHDNTVPILDEVKG